MSSHTHFHRLKKNMATVSAAVLDRLDKQGIPKSKRKLQKHLRSAGLAYISRTGKLIPAKKVAEELCQCPQKCDERVPMEARDRLFAHFYGLGEADLQNQFLRQNMDLRARLNVPENNTGSGRSPRRITCKYLVPLLPGDETVEVCQKAFVSAFVITTKRVRLQREKLISSLGLNSYSSHSKQSTTGAGALTLSRLNTIENQKKSPSSSSLSGIITTTTTLQGGDIIGDNDSTIEDDDNNAADDDGIIDMATPFKFLSSCELLERAINDDHQSPKMPRLYTTTTNNNHNHKPRVKRLIDNPLIPVGLLVPDGVTIAPVVATPDHDRDIAIVNNFFSNQLWKPEYIGTYS